MEFLFQQSQLVTGLIMVAGAVIVFPGSIYLLLYTNMGKKLGFLVAGAGLFGWTTIHSVLFILYSPRGPRPTNLEGLNSFQIRIIPIAYLAGSLILLTMFLVALNRLEAADQSEE